MCVVSMPAYVDVCIQVCAKDGPGSPRFSSSKIRLSRCVHVCFCLYVFVYVFVVLQGLFRLIRVSTGYQLSHSQLII